VLERECDSEVKDIRMIVFQIRLKGRRATVTTV
jgi:hypothetical protein